MLQKNNVKRSGNMMMLVSVTVVGSAGPIRFLAKKNERVDEVIKKALKSYEREGRLPVLGCNYKAFMLYCPTAAGVLALSPCDTIGSHRGSDFRLYKNPPSTSLKSLPIKEQTVGISLKGWISRSLHLKISSH